LRQSCSKQGIDIDIGIRQGRAGVHSAATGFDPGAVRARRVAACTHRFRLDNADIESGSKGEAREHVTVAAIVAASA